MHRLFKPIFHTLILSLIGIHLAPVSIGAQSPIIYNDATGFVGIGATNPQSKLHIKRPETGDVTFQFETSNGVSGYLGRFQKNFDNASGKNYFTYLGNNAVHEPGKDQSHYRIGNKYVNGQVISLSYDGIGFYYFKNTEKDSVVANGPMALLNSEGNLGIGTITPQAKLHVNGRIRGKYEGHAAAKTVESPGWYRIARTNSKEINRANAKFILNDTTSTGGQSTVVFQAGVSKSDFTNAALTVLSHHFYIRRTFTKLRLLTGRASNESYLEVYVEHPGDVSVSILDNLHADGWVPEPWKEGKTYPEYTTTEFDLNVAFAVHQDDKSPTYFSTPVGIGGQDPNYALTVNGGIKAKELFIPITWADYVFKDNYRLRSLQEVEQHITDKGHLPGIPSEAEVNKTGIDVAKMQQLLLEKIEELTLYTIRQQKTISKLQDQVTKLQSHQNTP